MSPSQASDIGSHSHYDGLTGFKTEKGDCIHHLNESPKMKTTVLTDAESWELADLMKCFYVLREAAKIYCQGNAHVSGGAAWLKDPEAAKRINQIDIPRITARVLEILNPAYSAQVAA